MLLLSLHSNVQMIVHDPELLDALLLVPQLLEVGLLVVGAVGDECCYCCKNDICESSQYEVEFVNDRYYLMLSICATMTEASFLCPSSLGWTALPSVSANMLGSM